MSSPGAVTHVDSTYADTVEPADSPFLTRYAAELEYHARVLAGGADATQPLLERVRFCAFFTSLSDEFFRVRIPRLREKTHSGPPASPTAREEMQHLRTRFRVLSDVQQRMWLDQLQPALADHGIHVRAWDELTTAQRKRATELFDNDIFPILTPLAVGRAHPFPFVSDLSISFAVQLDNTDGGPSFARVKIPEFLDRLVNVSADSDDVTVLCFVEEIIGAHLERLFPHRTITRLDLFRVTRDADYDVEDPDIDDLRSEVSSEIHARRFGEAVRLEVTAGTPTATREFLRQHLGLSEDDVLVSAAPLDLGAVDDLYDLPREDLKRPALEPVDVPAFEDRGIFAALRSGDILVHHPYESFQTSTQRFIETAADDPRVLAIKQTLYRTSGDSPIAKAMIRAARQGKQCVMLVELMARFDEATNLGWADKLEAAGVHVVHGFVQWKTHTKTAIVVRRDEDGVVRQYGHIATGNYNSKTARYYEDFGFFTADESITRDLGMLFNMLTAMTHQFAPKKLLIAPTTLRPRLLELIAGQAHEDGRIVVKTNHITHTEIMDALIKASQAGAVIDVIVRTTACLIPGVPGMTENIRVKCVAGPLLEHSRIYKFGSDPEAGAYLIGSADLMARNVDHRVEAVVPIEDPRLRARLDHVIDELLADEAWSWTMRADGSWVKPGGPRDVQSRLAKNPK